MEYPVTISDVLLSNSVVVSKGIHIVSYSVGNLGFITLTPMQPQASKKGM